MAAATIAAHKMAAICMVVLTMGQLMAAAAAGASAPLLQGDAAPARRLLAADHERPASEYDKAMAMMSSLRLLQKKGNCVCSLLTLWCCEESQKTSMMSLQLLQKTGNCDDCTMLTPWCCFGAGGGSAATN